MNLSDFVHINFTVRSKLDLLPIPFKGKDEGHGQTTKAASLRKPWQDNGVELERPKHTTFHGKSWLFNRDPHIGLLKSLSPDWVV